MRRSRVVGLGLLVASEAPEGDCPTVFLEVV